MTLPVERTNAVINTEQFLLDLLFSKKTPRVPKEIRQRASQLLRHFPSRYEMEMIAEEQDNNSNPLAIKIFGKTFDYEQ